jgi:hypothetical protein
MTFLNHTSENDPNSPSGALTKHRRMKKRMEFNFLATFAFHHRKALGTVVFSIFLFCTSGHFTKTWAIDIYHFLVEYKNGRVVERIFPESPESYQMTFKEYVTKTKLIEKRHYSLDGFIRTFGEDSYERLVTGYFGVGLEEQIIYNRQTQGLELDSGALPPPDKTSAKLLEVWKYMEDKNVMPPHAQKVTKPTPNPHLKPQPPTILKTNPAQAAVRKKTLKGKKKPQTSHEETGNITHKAKKEHLNQPIPPNPPKSPEPGKIAVYRFLVLYINGKVMEKSATMTPEQYQKRYQEYVKKTALIEKKTYTESQFKNVFGKNAHNLLIQGNFGVSDIEMIMQSRMERGMPPRENVLPEPGTKSETFSKKLEHLLRNKNFTLRGP